MKNKLDDAINHAFMALERLNDEDLDNKQLQIEIQRAEAVAKITDTIIKANAFKLNALRLLSEGKIDFEDSRRLLNLNAKNQ
jgi:hypothetical protein